MSTPDSMIMVVMSTSYLRSMKSTMTFSSTRSRHLPVRDGEAELRADALQEPGHRIHRLHAIVHEERLAATVGLAQERVGDEIAVELADLGVDRHPVPGRRGDERDVARAAERRDATCGESASR